MPPQRVASNPGRTTRHSKRLASVNGEEVSPLRSLPAAPAPTRKAPYPRGTTARTRRVEVDPSPSSIEDADDSASLQRDSRSESVDEPESRSSSPPREQLPVRRSTRTSRSASRSVSPVSARTKKAPSKAAGSRSRRATAPSATPELEAIIESPQRALPGSFPAAGSETTLPTIESDVGHTHTSTTYKTAIKRRQESSPEHGVGSFNNHVVKKQKRSLGGKYTATPATPSHASNDVEESASLALTTTSHTSPAHTTPLNGASPSTTAGEGTSDPIATPAAASGGFFNRVRNFFPRSAGPAVRTQPEEQTTPVGRAPEVPPHILAILESPISGPTLNSTTTPVVFPGPPRPVQSEPRHSTGGAWEAYAKHRPPPPLFKKLPSSARKPIHDDVDDIVEISDHEDCFDLVGIPKNRTSRALLRKHTTILENKKLERSRSVSKNTSGKSPKPTGTPTSDSSMIISNIIPSNALIVPANSTDDQIVLTDPKLIDLVRSVVTWAKSNPESELPDGQQMTSLLDNFGSKSSVDESAVVAPINNPSQSTALVLASPTTTTTTELIADLANEITAPTPVQGDDARPILDCVYDRFNPIGAPVEDGQLYLMSGGLVHTEESDSEVQQPLLSSPFISSPPTHLHGSEQGIPAATPNTPSRGWLSSAASAAKTVVASPFKMLGFGGQATPTTPATPSTAQLTEEINLEPQESILLDPKSPTPFSKRRTQRSTSRSRAGHHSKPKYTLKPASVGRSEPSPRPPRSALKRTPARPISDDEDDRHREIRSAKRVTWGENDEEPAEPSPTKNDHGKRPLSPGKTFRVPEPDSSSDEDDESDADEADFWRILPESNQAALKLIQDLEDKDPDRAYRLCRKLSERIKQERERAAGSAEDRGIARIVAEKMTAYEKYHSGAFHVQRGHGPLNPAHFLSPISERSERSRSSLSPKKRSSGNVFMKASPQSTSSDAPQTPGQYSPQTSPFQWSVASGRPGPSSFGVPDIDYGSSSDEEDEPSDISMSDVTIPLSSLQSENRDSNETLPVADRGNEVAVEATPLKERAWPQTPGANRQPKTPLPESVKKYQPLVPSNLRNMVNVSSSPLQSSSSPSQPDENLFNNPAFIAADNAPTPPDIVFPTVYDVRVPGFFGEPEEEEL